MNREAAAATSVGWGVMFLAAVAAAGPVDVSVDCPAVDTEAVAELETRIRLEADLSPHWTGRVQLDCREDRAVVRHFGGGHDLRERTGPLRDAADADAVKHVLLELALTLLDEAPSKPPAPHPKPPRDGSTEFPTHSNEDDPPPPEPAAPLAAERLPSSDASRKEPPVETAATSPKGGSPLLGVGSTLWALDTGLAYEHFGGGALGAASVELGGAKYMGPPLAVHVGASAGFGVQSPAGLQSRLATVTLQVELRLLPWLVLGSGPLYSFASFAGDRSLGHEVSVSRQWGGQLDLRLAPAKMSSGPMLGLRSRVYAKERSVRVDLDEVLSIPPWTFTVTLGYRFFGGHGARYGISKRAR